MAETSRSGRNAGDVDEQIKVIKDEVAELTKLMKALGEDKFSDVARSARDHVDDWVSKSRQTVGEAGVRVKARAESVEDFVIEKPVQSAFIALLVGLVIGSMTRR